MAQPIWNTPAGSIGQFLERRPIIFQFEAASADGLSSVIYTLQSGKLPAGLPEHPLTIRSDGRLIGIPAEVGTDIIYSFTIRATDALGNIRDRSFTMTVTGASPPRFLTYPGTIISTVDSRYVYYQIRYENTDPDNNPFLKIINGRLPPGLEMTPLGLITGYPLPPLSGLGLPTSKVYNFTVQLTTDSGIITTNYNIIVVNYYLENPIPSANARPPVILNSQPLVLNPPLSDPYYGYYMPYDGAIGRVRHNNEWVYKIIGYDYENTGVLTYDITGLSAINNSNPLSPGTLSLDTSTGWITGRFPDIGNKVLDFYLTATVTKTAPSGFSTGNILGISSISNVSPAIVTTLTPHGFYDGQQITIADNIPSTINSTNIYVNVLSPTTFAMYQNQGLTVAWPATSTNVTTTGICWANEYTRTSQVYRYTLTLVGNLDNDFTWVSPTYLGNLINGQISTLGVKATTNLIGETINYRIVSSRQENFNSVAYGAMGAIVSTTVPYYTAVGDLGSIAYSTDFGKSWTYVNQFSFDSLQSVAYGYYPTSGNGLLVAVGYDQSLNPKIYRSTDSMNWSPAATAGNYQLYDVIFDDRTAAERWIAVGNNALIVTGSQTGFLWNEGTITVTGSTSGDIGYVFNKIIRSAGTVATYRYTVVGNNDTGNAAIYWSEDLLFPNQTPATTWNAATFTPISIIDISQQEPGLVITSDIHNLYDGQEIVISGVLGMTQVNGNTYYVKSSGYIVNTFALYEDSDLSVPLDTTAFTAYISGGSIAAVLPPLNSVATDGLQWVAVGDDGIILQSQDGENWSLQAKVTEERLKSVIYDADLMQFFIVGSDGYTAYSADGLNRSWSYISGKTGNDLNSIVYGLTVPKVGYLITNITNASPAVVTTDQPHQLENATEIYIKSVIGMTEINEKKFYAKPLTVTTFELYTDESLTVPFSTVSYSEYESGGTMQQLQRNFVAVGQNGTTIYSRTIEVYNPEAITQEYDEFYYDETLYDQNANFIIEWISPTLGELPPNLTFLRTGEIAGRLVFEATFDQAGVYPQSISNYYFYVQAYIVGQEEINETKEFYFTTYQKFSEPYETIYMQCYPTLLERYKLNELLRSDSPGDPNTIIPTAAVYRVTDPYFGRAKNIVYNHAYGIPASTIQEYLSAININHYWRDITLGELKTAVARNSSGEIIYEVVYSEIIDDLINNNGVSVSKQVVWKNLINLNLGPFYDSATNIWTSYIFAENPVTVEIIATPSANNYELSSVQGLSLNMILGNTVAQPYITAIDIETNVVTLNTPITTPWVSGDAVTFYKATFYTSQSPGYLRSVYPNSLPNMRKQEQDQLGFYNDDALLPAWMTSQQLDGSTLGFIPAWVIAYCNPGYSTTIKNNINNWQNSSSGIKFNKIQFTIDRFEVDKQLTFDWNGKEWVSVLPSSQPPVTNNSKDIYVLFKQKTILPYTIEG